MDLSFSWLDCNYGVRHVNRTDKVREGDIKQRSHVVPDLSGKILPMADDRESKRTVYAVFLQERSDMSSAQRIAYGL
jgi:hypothetical protein